MENIAGFNHDLCYGEKLDDYLIKKISLTDEGLGLSVSHLRPWRRGLLIRRVFYYSSRRAPHTTTPPVAGWPSDGFHVELGTNIDIPASA